MTVAQQTPSTARQKMTAAQQLLARWRPRAVDAGRADAGRDEAGSDDTGRDEAGLDAVSGVLRAISALRGGVAVNQVWSALERDGFRPAAQHAPEWRVVAAVWQLATESGAPIIAALERLADALRALERLGQRRDVLLSGPRSTIRLVGALPLAAIALGALLGFDPIPLLISPAGALLAAFGSALLVTGMCWARRMSRSLERVDHIAGLEFELVWIALGGGAPPTVAIRRVVDCADQQGAEWIRLSRFSRGGPVREAFRSAETLGVPVGPMLLAQAEAARARAHAELETRAERLGVRILIPLAVCVLPAFIVLGVIPVLLSVLGGMRPI